MSSAIVRRSFAALIAVGVFAGALFWADPLWGQPAEEDFAFLDSTCSATVLGRNVGVNPDGTFRIRNIPVGNPAPLVRVEGTCVRSAGVVYWRSPCFELIQRESAVVPAPLEFRLTPFPDIEKLRCTAINPVLTLLGTTAQLQTTAQLSDDSERDVTPRSECTNYRSTNSRICTVSEDGLCTAVGPGTVFIRATNAGVTTFCRIDVVPGDPLTTVVGLVRLADGVTPAVGATVNTAGFETTTDAAGAFSIPNVPTTLGDIVVTATLDDLAGASSPTTPVQAGVTDVGIIALELFDCPTLRIGDETAFSGNCFPFGCTSNTQWQQIWDSSYFDGKLLIKNFSFFNRTNTVGLAKNALYTITMSTTGKPATAAGLTGSFAGNLGSDATLVFSGFISGAELGLGPIRTIHLTTPFCYDPSQGNLILQVFTSQASGGSVFFDMTSNPNIARKWTPSSQGTSGQLVMEFNTPLGETLASETPSVETETPVDDHSDHNDDGTPRED